MWNYVFYCRNVSDRDGDGEEEEEETSVIANTLKIAENNSTMGRPRCATFEKRVINDSKIEKKNIYQKSIVDNVLKL